MRTGAKDQSTSLKKIEAGRYRLGKYLIVREARSRWRVWCINYEPTLNSREHREGAETELEALRTFKQAIEYARRELEFEGTVQTE